MKVIGIRDIQRKEAAIEYRRMYTGTATLSLNGAGSIDVPIEFTLEHTALGSIDISVNLLREIEYPVLPVINDLKEYIHRLSTTGQLS
ncbi:MAG: hypothetical protein LC641_12800 [Spirochaeta sp.]|nr:hypothetical protein [Spirochaeta sp.]